MKVDNLRTWLKIALDSEAVRELPEGTQEQFRRLSGAVVAAVEKHDAEIAKLRAEGTLTEKGLARRRAELREDVEAAKAEILRRVIPGIESRIDAERQKVTGAARPTGIDAVLQYMQDRELRDQLRGEDPLIIQAKYLAACRSGEDDALIAAVEGAPRAFRLVSEDVLKQGADARVERLSPLSGSLASYVVLLQTLCKQADAAIEAPADAEIVTV